MHVGSLTISLRSGGTGKVRATLAPVKSGHASNPLGSVPNGEGPPGIRARRAFIRLKRRPRAWALRVAERSGYLRARVALARKLAIVMLVMWKTDADDCPRMVEAKSAA